MNLYSRRSLLAAAACLPAAPLVAEDGRRAFQRAQVADHAGEKVVFSQGDRTLFEYRYTGTRPKTYVHPLYAPNGAPISQDSPADHVHHRGLMLAWSDVKGFDFWGEANTDAPHGRIVHRRFEKFEHTRGHAPGFVELNDWIAGGKVLVMERRTLRAPDIDPDATWLEWESELRAAEGPVALSAQGHPYDGLGIRFVASMDRGSVLNSNGTSTIEAANGEAAHWCAYTGSLGTGCCTVAIFNAPANPCHPAPFFVMNMPFGYLSAAPTFKQPLMLANRAFVRLKYAVAVWNGQPDRETLDKAFRRWSGK